MFETHNSKNYYLTSNFNVMTQTAKTKLIAIMKHVLILPRAINVCQIFRIYTFSEGTCRIFEKFKKFYPNTLRYYTTFGYDVME